jgi:hypothetical protein
MTKDNKVTSATGSDIVNAAGSTNVAPKSSSGRPAPGMMSLPPLDEHTTEAILTASREMPSWEACELVEGTSWDGTAEENIKKYRRLSEL